MLNCRSRRKMGLEIVAIVRDRSIVRRFVLFDDVVSSSFVRTRRFAFLPVDDKSQKAKGTMPKHRCLPQKPAMA
jgi:hypothetical protein